MLKLIQSFTRKTVNVTMPGPTELSPSFAFVFTVKKTVNWLTLVLAVVHAAVLIGDSPGCNSYSYQTVKGMIKVVTTNTCRFIYYQSIDMNLNTNKNQNYVFTL